jgi:hypothetical protein
MIIMLDTKLDHETSAVEKDNFIAVDRGVNFIQQHEEFKLVPVLVACLPRENLLASNASRQKVAGPKTRCVQTWPGIPASNGTTRGASPDSG